MCFLGIILLGWWITGAIVMSNHMITDNINTYKDDETELIIINSLCVILSLLIGWLFLFSWFITTKKRS